MTYADYAFYTDIYKGRELKPQDFEYYAERTTNYLDSLPGSAAGTDEDKIEKACCAIYWMKQLLSLILKMKL